MKAILEQGNLELEIWGPDLPIYAVVRVGTHHRFKAWVSEDAALELLATASEGAEITGEMLAAASK